MSTQRTSLEIIAPTIEEAVANGLVELGLPREAVEVETLDEGSRGLFGLGSRQARVRLTILASPESLPQTQEEEIESVELAKPKLTLSEEAAPTEELEEAVDLDRILEVTTQTVQELLEKMGIDAQVKASFSENVDSCARVPVMVDVRGPDLSILIGRHAETLNALQYITSLIIGKEMGHSVFILLDVEGYRQRREQQLRQLARRIADQALKTGRRQVLEPMPANERRLIHIELRDHPTVKTESIGEEPHRKVTIIPK
jgi:spoIIIJ-associated protein